MKALIVEDETAAAENLAYLLRKIAPGIEIMANTESVEDTVAWLSTNKGVDLIFMDIHLSDGPAFAIFDHISIDTPIIFTTAYDQYALDAFKVNSIDYLLKPIKQDELKRAINKFQNRPPADLLQYLTSLNTLGNKPKYSTRLLIPEKDKLLPVTIADISYIYNTNRHTEIALSNGRCYNMNKSLDSLMPLLDPSLFIRANKQFIISRNAIRDLTIWFDNRLRVSLFCTTKEPIYISKNKVAEFKAWFTE